MWIDLSPPLAQKALERIAVFRFTEKKDDDVIELLRLARSDFFNPWLAAPKLKGRGGIAIEDLLEQLCTDDRDWAEVAATALAHDRFSARARLRAVIRAAKAKPTSILAYVDPKLKGKAVIANPLFGTTTAQMAVGKRRAEKVEQRLAVASRALTDRQVPT